MKNCDLEDKEVDALKKAIDFSLRWKRIYYNQTCRESEQEDSDLRNVLNKLTKKENRCGVL